MEPIHERVAGIDVHRMKHVVTVLISGDGGAVSSETREFGGFKRDMRALVDWLRSHRIQQVVMESRDLLEERVFASRGGRNSPWSSMPSMSGTCRVARPMSATRNGWPSWRASGFCAAASFRQRIFANSVSYQGIVKN